ncbi:MAG TPA: hypothetical protein VGN83_27515 [Falsiroseomonas sp.]|jgi:hypothetical protein|nr:hypothetical protein [Falsiroseomonas sp.]
MKANYAAQGGEVRLRWSNGVLIPEASGVLKNGVTWDTIRALFQTIDRAWKEGKPLSTAPQTRGDGRYFPAVAHKLHQVLEKQAAKMAEDWIIEGYLSVEEVDAKAHLRGLKVIRWLSPTGA